MCIFMICRQCGLIAQIKGECRPTECDCDHQIIVRDFCDHCKAQIARMVDQVGYQKRLKGG